MPGLSSGRAVLMLMVAPMPPVGVLARLVLNTSMPEIDSDARLAKSNARELEALDSSMLAPGICRPFNSTRLKSGPTPRTVTREPSPSERSIDTPLMRCSDSARLVSGNLPMSSATMPSTMPCASRLTFIDEVRLPRMPLTCTVSSVAGSAWLEPGTVEADCGAGAVCAASGADSANSKADVRRRVRGKVRGSLTVFLPQMNKTPVRAGQARLIKQSCIC